MKYIRQIAVWVISALFVVAVAIGICVIFSVKNVNVTYINYGEENPAETIATVKEKLLNEYRGSVISFIDENEVDRFVGEGFVVEEVKKVLPCTLNVKIRERRETYVIKEAENYKVYDFDGKYIKNSNDNINSVDNSPNVLLTGCENSNDIEELAGQGKIFLKKFSSLRPVVSEIEILKAQSAYDENKYIFYLRCGLIIEISDNVFIEEKIEKAAEVFASLTGEQKLGGKIYCYTTLDTAVKATYNPNV